MESHIIELTEAARQYGNLNLRCCGKDFFPQDAFGGSDNSKRGVPILLKVEGITELIETDIPTDATTGRPRWIFRERGWVKQFIRSHNLSPGDKLVISRVEERTYEITTNGNGEHSGSAIVASCPYLDRVYFEDARKMKELPSESMHLVITSPPYYNIKDYSLDGRQQNKTGQKAEGQIGDIQDYEKYLRELTKVWKECWRVLKPNGKLCVNTPLMPLLKSKSNTHYTRDIVDINAGTEHEILKNTKFFLYDVFIWNRTNPSKNPMFGIYPYDN
jgi:hypothetical protein